VIKGGLPEDMVHQGSPKRPAMSTSQIRMRFWCPTGVSGIILRERPLFRFENWREWVGVEPTRDGAGRPATILKFGLRPVMSCIPLPLSPGSYLGHGPSIPCHPCSCPLSQSVWFAKC